MRLLNYNYYGSPDGKECVSKTFHTAKLGTALGLFVASYDVLMYSHPKGYLPTMGRVFSFAFPAALTGATFSATTCIVSHLRQKDDCWNHTIGGLVAGTIMGMRFNIAFGGISCLVLAGVGFFKKLGKMNNWENFIDKGHRPHRFGGAEHYKYDWSLIQAPKEEED